MEKEKNKGGRPKKFNTETTKLTYIVPTVLVKDFDNFYNEITAIFRNK